MQLDRRSSLWHMIAAPIAFARHAVGGSMSQLDAPTADETSHGE